MRTVIIIHHQSIRSPIYSTPLAASRLAWRHISDTKWSTVLHIIPSERSERANYL